MSHELDCSLDLYAHFEHCSDGMLSIVKVRVYLQLVVRHSMPLCFPLASELHCLTNDKQTMFRGKIGRMNKFQILPVRLGFFFRGLFVKQWSSEDKGKHLERHRVPDNKLEVYSDLNLDLSEILPVP